MKTQPNRVDWDIAFRWYASDPTRSGLAVAKQFHVSSTAVYKHTRRGGDFPEGWAGRRAELLARAAAGDEAAIIRTLQARRDDTIRISEGLRRIVLDAIENGDIDAETAAKLVPIYAKLEELFAGEATDRITMTEAQVLLQDVLVMSTQVVMLTVSPAERRAALMAGFNELVAGLTRKSEGSET